jgi:hypothetical protein
VARARDCRAGHGILCLARFAERGGSRHANKEDTRYEVAALPAPCSKLALAKKQVRQEEEEKSTTSVPTYPKTARVIPNDAGAVVVTGSPAP